MSRVLAVIALILLVCALAEETFGVDRTTTVIVAGIFAVVAQLVDR